MTFEEAKATRDGLQSKMSALSAKLQAYPKSGTIGLTPDDIKYSAEFQRDKAAFEAAFAQLRAFNARFVKQYRRELAAERRSKANA